MSSTGRTGIVLSGGGSRGAYEAGVMLFVRTRLAQRLGRQISFDVISGTSVGAINASYLAATANALSTQAAELCEAWTSLRIEDLISLGARDLLRAIRQLVGEPPPPKPGAFRHGGLLGTEGLERFVIRMIPWRRIRGNLLRNHLTALTVSATHVGSGHTVVFVDSTHQLPTRWSSDPFVRHVRTAIGPRHALASAAIPLLFPAVKIGRAFYVDGGLRQNTPLSPAIRLGADRILVVSLRHQPADQNHHKAEERLTAYPKPLFLAGKALNALLLDHTEYDLQRLERMNAILEAGKAAFGDRFEKVLGDELTRLRGAPVHRVDAVHISPSQDIGAMAARFATSGRLVLKSRAGRRLFNRLGGSEAAHESDLMSYFLFDGTFARDLIELGFQDAAAMEDRLAEVFEQPQASAAGRAADGGKST